MLTLVQLASILWILPLLFLEAAGAIGVMLGSSKRDKLIYPEVSFLVAAWKEGGRIKKCVDSILNQRYPKNKIKIFVIGGGDENTVNVCSKLARENKITYTEEKERTGKWFALNRGLSMVKGEYVAFTDADCVLEENWLTKMLSSDADITIADVYSTSENSFYGKMYAYVWNLTMRVSEGLNRFLKTGEFMGQGSLVKKKVFNRIRFEKSFVEDWRFNYNAKKAGFSVGHSRAKTYEHMPGSYNDFRKAGLRTMKGFLTEMSSIGDLFSILIVVTSVVALVSIPAHAYNILSGDVFGLQTLLLLIVFTSLFSFVSAMIDGNYRFVFYSPLIILVVAFFCLSAIETSLKLLMKKEINWEIYGKKEK